MDRSPYAGSGAGGKIRRRPPSRASATPYERPPAAAAAHRLAAAAAAASSGPSGEGSGGGGSSSGWVSRLVDPASRLLAGGAARLFSSVFRNRLGPAPAQEPQSSSPSGRNMEPKQDMPESYVNSTLVMEDGLGKGKNPAGTSDDKALSEVEHLLMRKTFTKVEFDRLTDLLRERTIESDLPASMVSYEGKNEGGTRINEPGGPKLLGMAADYSPTVKVHSQGVGSPAELAKQYMSSRYSREPQSSSLRSRLFLQNKREASSIAYDRRSGQPVVQAPVEFGNENPGLPVNGYATPGLRGRSAIYRMSRSPYFKGPSTSSDVNMSSLSQRAQSLHVGDRQVLKRRGADLENEHGSIGPIRRIRQKSNMMSSFRDARANSRENLLASRTSGSDFADDNSPIQESPSSKRLLLGTGQSVRLHEFHKNGRDVSGTVPPIPPQSNKMAEKIFEQLNIIAPSPKEKQSGKQSAGNNNSSPSMSKEPVLQDSGPSSMGDPSSSLKFHDLDGANGPIDQELNGSKKGKLKLINDGSSKVASPDKHSILGNSVSAATSRKPGFKMAVSEKEFLELDDDMEAPIPPKNSASKIEVGATEQKFDSNRKEQKVEQNMLGQKVGPSLLKDIAVGSPVSDKPTASVSKNVSSSGVLSSNDPGKTDSARVAAENNTGFTFSHVPSDTQPESITPAQPVASVKDIKQSGALTSIFGLKQSSASDLETSTDANVLNKVGFSQSVNKPTLDSTSSEKGDKRGRAEDGSQSSDKVLPSAASATLNAPFHFASGTSTSPGLSNGFSYSSSQKLTPTDKPTLSSAPSTTIFALPSTSAAISSSTQPAAFSFGSSASVGSSMAASVKAETAEAKPATTLTFGIGGTTAEAKSTAPDSTSKPASTFLASPISSNVATFSSSPTSSASIFSSVSTFSSSSSAASSVAAVSTTTTAPSSTSSTAPGVQSSSTVPSTFSSSGGIFGFSSTAQSTALSTSVAPSTSQPPAASALFGSKLQSEGTISQPSQSSVAQFGSPFTSTSGSGASSSGSGTVSFGVGASAGSGTTPFGVGTSSSAPGTVAFGTASSSSGPGIFSFGAGASSSGSGTVSFGLGAGAALSGPGTVSFGAGAASSGPGSVSFGTGAASSGPGTVSFGVGAASSGPGTVSFGVGAASSGSGTVSFGVGAASSGSGTVSFGTGAASSGPGTVAFGAGASSSGPATVSFGATTSASGSVFGNSPFGGGATFANPFSSTSGTGFTFSSPSSSAVSSTVANTSVFSSSSGASSTSSFSNPIGSSSSSPSTFTFGQSASSGGGFAFGAQSAPAFSSQPSVFSFTSASTSMNSSTAQPAFGTANTNTGFGMGSTGNDQMNDDSMADDTNLAAPMPAPIFGSPFGQQGNSPAAPVFGASPVQSGGVFQFGGQQQGSVPQNPAFPPAGSLEFQSGGFSLGSGGAGGDKSNRRVIKVKRGPKKR